MTISSLIQRVTLTGVDDHTSLSELSKLTDAFPFVEWAVLYTPHREGVGRNPGKAWREAFFEALAPHSAVHLCGAQAFEQLLAGALSPEILRAKRMQLNINVRRDDFAQAQVLEVFARALDLCPAVILQYHPRSAELVGRFISTLSEADAARCHVLMDASGGTGRSPERWSRPEALNRSYVGFAGGLGVTNIRAALNELSLYHRPYWVDMETGVRTDERFDVTKAALILELAGVARETLEHALITKKQALEALDNLDDYARMEVGVDAVGPRTVLERFIIQAQCAPSGYSKLPESPEEA